MDAAVAQWARRVPVDEIPAVCGLLLARFLEEANARRTGQRCTESTTTEPNKLLTARELAEHLNLPESWVRSEERAGRIPSFRPGKYVRFKLADVERALAERPRQGAKNR